jgi:RimJ/RimL family protein N-acetyltransferase
VTGEVEPPRRRSAPLWGGGASERFLAGLATQVGLDRADIGRPGTTVVSTGSRSGSSAVACYRADRRLLLWCDPAVTGRLAGLARDDRSLDEADLIEQLARIGFDHAGGAVMYLLAEPPMPAPVGDPSYRRHHLHAERPHDLALIRSLVDRCDPADVEEADLDDLDNLTDTSIHVLTPERPDGEPVAYASAAPWDWDSHFGDIAVLVDPEHRRRGLGARVTALTVNDLVASGRAPLYRHDVANAGSRAVAGALGFRPVASLSYHQLPAPPGPPTPG